MEAGRNAPTMLDLNKLLELVEHGGTVAILVLIIWCLITGKVVPRWQYDRETMKSDALWELVKKSVRIGETVANGGSRHGPST